MFGTIVTSNFLGDLAMVLCVGAVSTVVFQALKQPIVVGYLVAGVMVGPYLPIPLLANYDRIHMLSELGVILLMFALGLEFSIRKLIRLGPTSGFIMAIQVGLMLWLGYMCGRALGWTRLECIFTGALLSISSTTIVAKAYGEMKLPEKLRDLVFGVLLMEDLAAVVELAILTALASGAGLSASVMGATIARLAIFLALLVGIGIVVVPRLIRLVVRLDRPETTLIASVGICFAFAIIAEHAGYSVALGSFLAGSLVAESGDVHQIEHLVAPLRDMFGAVFFVSVGMMINPGLIAEHWVALLLLTFVVIFGKVFGVGLASLLAGAGIKTSVEAGMSLAQIGEFSFIIAGVGLQLGATRDFIYTMAVAVSALTTFLTPFMIRAAVPAGDFVAGHFPEPIVALQSLYDSWMERIRSARDQQQSDLPPLHWPIAMIAGSATIIGALLIFNEFDPFDFTTRVAQAVGLPYFDAGLGVDFVALIICAPFAYGLYYGSRKLARALAMRALPESKRRTLETQWGTAERALIEMLQLTILLGVVMPLLAVVQPFMEGVEGIGIVVIAAILMGVAVWRSARLMQGQLRAAVSLLTSSIDAHRPAPSERLLVHEVPGLGSLTAVRVEEGAPAVGRPLSDLDLQAATGATVVALARNNDDYIIPEPDLVLRSGDLLELAGSSDSIAAAAAFLSKRPPVPAASPVV